MINYLFKKNVSLKDYCTFHIGGKAKILIEVYNAEYLNKVCVFCITHHIMYKVIGMGANLLFDDNGFCGAIIVNKSEKITFKGNYVFAESGTSLASLISACKNKGLSGVEKLVGIPSTIGGAIVNNTGAFGCEFKDVVDCVWVLNTNNKKICKLKNKDCAFGYIDSIFKSGKYIILKAKLKFEKKEAEYIASNLTTCLKQKSTTQPINYPSAGSVFKRGEIIPAQAIDRLSLKGLTVGGAMVSTVHAGFIVNFANAKSKDVKKLIDILTNKVFLHFNVLIEREIEYVAPK